MTARPRIGITMDHEPTPVRAVLCDAYFDAVFACGGLPILLAPISDPAYLEPALDSVMGLVMPGGDDFHPSAWGEEEVHPACTLVTARRQAFDLAVARLAFRRGLPLLAICCGMQALNVAQGGSVIQHLDGATDGAVRHKAPSGQPLAEHAVACTKGTRLRELVGADRIEVNSAHHQACGEVGAALRVAALSDDGVIEAIEAADGRFCLGLQWHPEKLIDRPVHRRLFEALAEAGRRRGASGRVTSSGGRLVVTAGYEAS